MLLCCTYTYACVMSFVSNFWYFSPQHQYHGSGHLVYVIIRQKEAFTIFRYYIVLSMSPGYVLESFIHALIFYHPRRCCVRNLLPRILKLATEQIEKQPGETASIADKETTTEPEPEPTTQTRTQEMHLQQPDTASLNSEENSTATANHSSTTVSADDQHESSSPPDIPISFQFTPSQKWVIDVQSDIDFNTIQALLSVLAPQVTTCVCV